MPDALQPAPLTGSSAPSRQSDLMLSTVTGPKPVLLALTAPQRYTIGRRSTLSLVLDHAEVSKDHAVLSFRADHVRAGAWFLADVGSRHGTRLNGIALAANRECPIVPGDLIEIAPWMFRVSKPTDQIDSSTYLKTHDDTLGGPGGSTVSSIRPDPERELAQERLRLLLRCAEALQRSVDERSMAETALQIAVSGTGYSNAAITRPMTAEGMVEVIACSGEIEEHGRARLSRTLIKAAGQGMPVELTAAAAPIREAVSIAEFGIRDAICVPLMIETTLAGLLYLDCRGRGVRSQVAPDASAFAVGVGRLVSMAWSNLMRRDLERRFARMEGELAAAASAQQLILPRRQGRCGPLNYIGECRPGRIVSGDFFDVLALPDGRVAVSIGDVAGKGVAASVLMTVTQGFLHGALRQHGDVVRAMNELNNFVHDRSGAAGERFVTLWAGVFDSAQGELTYVDAGHGYAWLLDAPGGIGGLDEGGGPPVAVTPGFEFSAAKIALPPRGRVLLVSDGIIEQPGRASDGDRPGAGAADQFSRRRVEDCLRQIPPDSDEVAGLFGAVYDHAGTNLLADDATVVLVKW